MGKKKQPRESSETAERTADGLYRLQAAKDLSLPWPRAGADRLYTCGDLRVRITRGRRHAVIEARRGPWERRMVLGSVRGAVTLCTLLPRHLLRVALEAPVILMPESKVRGRILVPLGVTLEWRTEQASVLLARVAPADMRTAWDRSSGWEQRVHSPFLDPGAAVPKDLCAVVPISLWNRRQSGVHIDHLHFRFAETTLRPWRGGLCTAVQRIVFGNSPAPEMGMSSGQESVA